MSIFLTSITQSEDIRDRHYLEVNVVVPVDKEKMPRNKKVVMKGRRVYFYEKKGKSIKL